MVIIDRIFDNMTHFQSNHIPLEEWTLRAKNHAAQVSPITDAFLKRRGLQIKHAVHDFLFTYYNFSTSKLKQWVPSFEECLIVQDNVCEEYSWLNDHWFSKNGNVLSLNRTLINQGTLQAAAFIANLCSNILSKTPRFNCFGLHEWAMIYKSTPESIRHQGYQLRISPDELAKFVESQMICCSHYDAYRFFTEDARPLNVLKPVLETRLDMEQGGCLHANMDLYKWATRLFPWIGSDFILKTFFLALKGRELDMRASPYDLMHEGYPPICIETEEGRKQYQKEQQQLAEESIILRKELHAFCKRFIGFNM